MEKCKKNQIRTLLIIQMKFNKIEKKNWKLSQILEILMIK